MPPSEGAAAPQASHVPATAANGDMPAMLASRAAAAPPTQAPQHTLKFHSSRVPPVGHFIALERGKRAAIDAGRDLIDLSVGMSDMPAPPEALEALREATYDPATHTYSLKEASLELLGAACDWYARRYNGVRYDPRTEALSVIGAQEGLAHLLMAVADHGDSVLLLDTCYPSYLGAMKVAGLTPSFITQYDPVTRLPALDRITKEQLQGAKALLLNYPNNPTSVTATDAFFTEALDFCRRHGLLLIHDSPYVDLVFDDAAAASPLSLPGARDCCVEIFSFSKSYHLAGFRLGYILGNADAIAALEAVKAPIDFNQNLAIQRMGTRCLHLPEERLRADAKRWRDRAAALVQALHDAGWVHVPMPKACMYVWARLPALSPPASSSSITADSGAGPVPVAGDTAAAAAATEVPLEALVCGGDDREFCGQLLAQTGVALGPGSGFGPGGHGYVRWALIQPPERLREAAGRAGEFLRALRGQV